MLSREQATRIKADVRVRMPEHGASEFTPRSMWFTPMRGQVLGRRYVSFKDVGLVADDEYDKWRTIDPSIVHSYDFEDRLISWLRTISVEELSEVLLQVPKGIEGMTFTPWQRLGLAVMCRLPFSVTSKIVASVETLRHLDRYADDTRMSRKTGLQATFSMREGSFPRCIICDLPTAGGKTAWSCTLASVVVCNRFASLREQFRIRAIHEAVEGPPTLPVARLVLIAPTASTWGHFVDTMERLILELYAAFPELRIILWKGMSRNYSVRIASIAAPNDVIFWVHPVTSRNKILCDDPDIAVAASVIDEYSVDTPREKTKRSKSQILHTIITQATPQALEAATTGCSSILQTMFGGALQGPSRMGRLLGTRSFKDAQLCMEQACKLDLFTMSAFRKFVRTDLEALVPRGFEIVFVRSRRFSITSHIARSSADMVPASLCTVIQRFIPHLVPDQSEYLTTAFSNLHMASSVVRPIDLVNTVQRLPPLTAPSGMPPIRQETVERQASFVRTLVERIGEFSSQCPICMEEEQSEVMMFGCCGYCICHSCWRRTARCPFCRSEIIRERVEEPSTNDVEVQYASDVVLQTDLVETINSNVNFARTQLFNFANVLRCTRAFGYRRFLVVVEADSSLTSVNTFDFARIASITGVDIQVPNVSGQGTRFRQLKARFDSDDASSIALVSFMNSSLLVGTNLDYVDCVIAVGNIPEHLFTQAIGRVFRPRATRDNSRPVFMVRIFS